MGSIKILITFATIISYAWDADISDLARNSVRDYFFAYTLKRIEIQFTPPKILLDPLSAL